MKALFHYDPQYPMDVRPVVTRDGVQDLTYATPNGARRAAYLVRPDSDGSHGAALFVHWYEPWAATSNRRQFLADARWLAERGIVSLLVETLWSDDDWFIKRTQDDDEGNTIQQVVELRAAMDLLLSQPGVDPRRFAYVGHDFGAMYGVLTGSIDPRPGCYVLMAGTPRFADWYLYYPPLPETDHAPYAASMARFDPITHVANLAPAPLLFQFADDDPHVPVQRAEQFYAAAREPKTYRLYPAGHDLNNELATAERRAWLLTQLATPA